MNKRISQRYISVMYPRDRPDYPYHACKKPADSTFGGCGKRRLPFTFAVDAFRS